MASDAEMNPSGGRQNLESRRAREFYRYYQPIRELTANGPPLCNLASEAAVEAHRPISSPDRALTAFCQLGALRLGTKRAMLFFFDEQYAYVLAEATRTLSLQDDSVHEIADDLWLGHTRIPRGYSVCEDTVMNTPNPGPKDSDSESDYDAMVHIVNDLSEDSRFCDRPFVTGGPRARFYAGVPITTPKGINIGAYCVLDDRKRDTLDATSMRFLMDMSATVMTHLDMVRAQAELRIGTQMVAGLGAFIDEASGSRKSNNRTVAKEAVQREQESPEPTTSPTRRRSLKSTSSRGSCTRPAASSTSRSEMRSDDVQDPVQSNTEKTFERAAAILREAMDVDGIMFFDAATSTSGGRVDNLASLRNPEMSSDTHNSSDNEVTETGTEGEDTLATKQAPSDETTIKHCRVLASSYSAVARPTDQSSSATSQHAQIPEDCLRSLLRRYPRGKTWSFNDDGDASSDDSSEHNADSKSCGCIPIHGDKVHTPTYSKRKRRSLRRNDTKEILRLFPGVRNFGLVGMWDHTRQRWYAACMFWTCSPLRLFSVEFEVKYMSAFCDVILAELGRMEAQTSDRAKSDFISSISHELRSPLHGILGSVECLQEQPLDSVSADLITQVDVCGRTLLDIIEHLLDFSKINHQARSGVAVTDSRGSRISSAAGRRPQIGGMMTLDADVALDHITEEVVETAVYSFCCSRDPEFVLKRKVAVILDIDSASSSQWNCFVAVGPWKRICINLVSNALKYTNEGHIKITLRASPISDKKKKFNVTLSVTDTGKGMSRNFLQDHLFRAFQQEDSFVEGTGLGLSLVATMVKALDGKIDVQSQQGVGTTVSVTLPLEHSRQGRETLQNGVRPAAHFSIAGLTVGVIESRANDLQNPSHTEISGSLLTSSICKTLDEAGARSTKSDWLGRTAADVYIVLEADLHQEVDRIGQEQGGDSKADAGVPSNRPIVVLCESAISARRLRAAGLGNLASEHVEYISQPAGPERIIRAVSLCFEDKSAVTKATMIAGAVKDGPSIRPDLEPSIIMHRPLALRQRHLDVDAPLKDNMSDPLRPEPKQDSSRPKLDRPPRSYMTDRAQLSDQKLLDGPTTMKDWKPATSDDRFKQLTRPPKPDVSAQSDGKEPISLLLVDDNPINLQLLVAYANKNRHYKNVAKDGLQAVEAYRATASERYKLSRSNSTNNSIPSPPTPLTHTTAVASSAPTTGPIIILMDINMPVLNGFEATRQIRGFEQRRGIPPATIIALTGLGSASAQHEAFDSGVDLFLTKPVRLKELTKILDGLRSG
ncbi:sensor histidine kinase/response regulator like protein [Zymoseptoria brevis]|uniref:histidine kinase n=1 Tax=Zymoseptoria brevis TaxID=1047168 RepID=A0A0F4GMD1_9PEZI|nr:sensor histidine kinase/response regulator like protein [Zymoseptoria brevis]